MGDTIVIETPVATVLEVSGKQGPQGVPGATGATGAVGPAGPAGTGIETLTTKGDLLSRNDSAAIRVGIGSTGQVLKVSAQGLPTWANESGAVTSVNGQTGAVTVAAATHATRHEADNEDELQATAALVATDVGALNGVYFWDGTTTSGRPNFFRTGTRKNTKIVYNSGTNQWNLVRNLTVEAVGVDGPDTVPWGNTWEDERTPPQVTAVTVTRLPLETMVQKLAETGAAATATTSEDGLMSSADKTKLNGMASGAEVNVNADWNATSGDAQILNKPSTFAPSAHSSSHAAGGSDPLAPSDIGAQFAFVTTSINLSSGDTYTIASGRARRIEVGYASSDNGFVRSPSSGSQIGDLIVVAWTTGSSGPAGNVIIQGHDGGQYVTLATLDILTESVRLIFKANGAWEIDSVYTHTHAASAITSGTLAHERGGLEADVSAYSGLVKISGGSTSAVGIGTGSTEVAAGDHGHGNLSSDGKLGSDSGRVLVTTTAGAVTTLALGTANQILRVNSGATGVEFADPAAAGVTSVTGTAPIVSSGGTTPAISINAATTSAAGSMSAADKTKLDGIATGATANSSDATLLNRANHTGTQAAATITGLAAIATSGSASDLGSGTVPIGRLGASGTPSGSTYLAGDNSWKAVTGGVSAMQSIAINFVLN